MRRRTWHVDGFDAVEEEHLAEELEKGGKGQKGGGKGAGEGSAMTMQPRPRPAAQQRGTAKVRCRAQRWPQRRQPE